MREKSLAKINLYLEIAGFEASGYHLLDSLMVFIDLYDLITIEKNSGFDLVISSKNQAFLKQNKQDNIISKTVELMAKKFNFLPQIKITLQKNIPVAAGLGGGSSNCATIILMLNKIYQLNLKPEELSEIGFELGCDVPFFLHQKAAFVSSLGEKISDLKIKEEELFLLLVNPNKSLATRDVYEFYDQKYYHSKNQIDAVQKQFQEIISTQEEHSLLAITNNRQNHLQPVAIEIIPEIKIILEALNNCDGCLLARMSGSGPSCFAIFKNAIDLDIAEKKMLKNYVNFYIKKSKIIYKL